MIERATSTGSIDQRSPCPVAGIVDHDIPRAERRLRIQFLEQRFHLVALAGVAGEGGAADFLDQRHQIVGRARGEHDLQSVLCKQARERSGKPLPGTHNERTRIGHELVIGTAARKVIACAPQSHILARSLTTTSGQRTAIP